MSFGEKLRGLIEENGLTQKELAGIMCIAPSTLGCYVQGVREPDFETLKMFAEYFGVTTDYLLGCCSSQNEDSALEAELLRVFRSLDSEQQKIYLDQGKAFIRAGFRHKE